MAKKLKEIWEYTARTWLKRKQHAINRLLQLGIKRKDIKSIDFKKRKTAGGWEFKAIVERNKLNRVI